MKYVNKLYRVGMVSKLRACAYALIITTFNEKIDAFIQSDRHIAINFLKYLEPHWWANAYFRWGTPNNSKLILLHNLTLLMFCAFAGMSHTHFASHILQMQMLRQDVFKSYWII